MNLAELRLQNLRCLSTAELVLHPHLNLVFGANGTGKTTLLEAVYLLGRGRSFRTRHTEQLIQQGADRLWIAGRLASSSGGDVGSDDIGSGEAGRSRDPLLPPHRVDLQCQRDQALLARIDAQPIRSLAELSQVLPVQVIDPGIHRLIEEGPGRRRRWLDWAVFHVEPGFVVQWQGYMRALRQRNAALRGAGNDDPVPWEVELARLGEALSFSRARVLDALQPYLSQALIALDAPPATLAFHRGWSAEVPLAVQLSRQRERDRQRGHTGSGPHRCDVVIQIAGRPARDVISRGQQKILGAALTVALAHCLASIAGRAPTLLLDDPAAELDAEHTSRLLHAATGVGGQCIVTVLRPESLLAAAPDRVFHVEHGGVKQL